MRRRRGHHSHPNSWTGSPSRADDPASVTWAQRAGRLGASATDARAYWPALFDSTRRYCEDPSGMRQSDHKRVLDNAQGDTGWAQCLSTVGLLHRLDTTR
jgi:hypothetical protein